MPLPPLDLCCYQPPGCLGLCQPRGGDSPWGLHLGNCFLPRCPVHLAVSESWNLSRISRVTDTGLRASGETKSRKACGGGRGLLPTPPPVLPVVPSPSCRMPTYALGFLVGIHHV